MSHLADAGSHGGNGLGRQGVWKGGKVPLSPWPAAVTMSGVGTGHARRHRRIEAMRDEAILRNGELKNRVKKYIEFHDDGELPHAP